jgi:hypothetical protein
MQSGKRASDETPRLKTFWRNEPNAARCGDRRSNYAAHKMLHDSMHQLELSRPGLAFGVAAHECRLPHTPSPAECGWMRFRQDSDPRCGLLTTGTCFPRKSGSGEPPSPGHNGEADFRKMKRSNDTHNDGRGRASDGRKKVENVDETNWLHRRCRTYAFSAIASERFRGIGIVKHCEPRAPPGRRSDCRCAPC